VMVVTTRQLRITASGMLCLKVGDTNQLQS
jgi:hypothetical protein